MSRLGRWVAGGAVVAGAVAAGFWQFGAGLPGLLSSVRNPVAAYHPVAWEQGPATPPAAGDQPPNVILIVADDLGFNDISFNGGGVAGGAVKTPNINSIGRDGVSFATAYAGNATCSPSRAAMMTGRYPTRYGFEYTAVPGSFAWAVSRAETNSPVPTIFHSERNHDLINYPEMGVPSARSPSPTCCVSAGITRSISANGT